MSNVRPIININQHDLNWVRGLYDLYYHSIRNFAYFKTGDIEFADKVVHETFFKIWSLRFKAKGRDVKSMLYTIAAHIIRVKYGKRKQFFTFNRKIHTDSSGLVTSKEVISDRFLKDFQVFLLQLSESIRVIFLMHCIEGLSYFEIAERLNYKPNVVEKKVVKALNDLEVRVDVRPLKNNLNSTNELSHSIALALTVPFSKANFAELWVKIEQSIRRDGKFANIRLAMMRWGAALILLIVVVSAVVDWRFATQSHETPYGKMAYLLLPDSSFVVLNAGTNIKYRKYGWNKSREVKLNGEALFNVKKSEVEFVVVTENQRVIAKSGRFNFYNRNSHFYVECLTNGLSVGSENEKIQNLMAGQGLVVYQDSSSKIYQVDIHQSVSWTNGVFHYTNKPLSMVFDELQRQFNVKILPKGFNPESISYSGYFTKDNLKQALEMVCYSVNLGFEINRTEDILEVICYPL